MDDADSKTDTQTTERPAEERPTEEGLRDERPLQERPIQERPRDERLASMSPDELRSAMRTLGYRTQNDLAGAIGVSRSAVSLWLEGKVGVPRPVAMLLRMLVAAQRRSF